MDSRVDDGAPWIEYVDLYNPIVSFQVNFLPWKKNMVFTSWGCFSFGCMRRSWNIFSSSCDSGNHQLTRTDWNDNIVGNNFYFIEEKLKAQSHDLSGGVKQVGVEEECVARLKLHEQMLKTLPSLGIVSLFWSFYCCVYVCEIDKKNVEYWTTSLTRSKSAPLWVTPVPDQEI